MDDHCYLNLTSRKYLGFTQTVGLSQEVIAVERIRTHCLLLESPTGVPEATGVHV